MPRKPHLRFFLLALLLSANLLKANTQPTNTGETWKAANQAYAEHSYRQAALLYEQLDQADKLPDGVSADDLQFRLADSQWRNLAATHQTDAQLINAPREALTELAAKIKKEAKGARPPQLWADIQESMGDSYWTSDQYRNWSNAWKHYKQALDWWAASTDIDSAREHYLDIVFRASMPPNVRPNYWRYGYRFGNWMPISVLQNAVEVAKTTEQKAHANYLLALEYMHQGNAQSLKAQAAFEAALKAPKSEWADDALFRYAEWAQSYGASYWDDHGHFRSEGNLTLALKLYQQFVERYPEGYSRYNRQAKRRIEDLTEQQLNVNIGNTFTPESVVEFAVNWRNLGTVEVAVYAVNLQELFQPEDDQPRYSPFDDNHFDLSGLTPLTRMTRQPDGKPMAQQHSLIELEEGLPAGAYVIQAKSGDQEAQGLLLVTEQFVTTIRDRDTILAWLTDAQTGKPIADGKVKVWLGNYQRNNNQVTMGWISATLETDTDGLARFTKNSFPELKGALTNYERLIAISAQGDQFNVASDNHNLQPYRYTTDPQNGNAWRVYAFTDRPAYRPGETIHWKAIARVRESLTNWRLADTAVNLHYRITGPQGEEVASGTMTPNEYGSIWGEFTAGADWKLGMYQMQFSLKKNDEFIGNAELFRLEEYKLPEFKVAIETASANGEAATAYRLGDEVNVKIQADYYFGGAVPNAEVNVVVRESPYYHYWMPRTSYPWLHSQPNFYRNPGKEVLNETLKTDAEGRAHLVLPTNGNSNQDLEYSIEARVVDESRREVTGRASIRVTRAPYFVNVRPERTLYRPGETASVTIETVNANEAPVQVEGKVRLTREEWMQIYRGPDGEEISGQEYRRRLNKGAGLFSSALDPNDWHRIRQGYDVEEIKTWTLTTNADGKATITFPIEKTGYYRVYWVSKPERSAPIKADTAIWAADSASQSIGYHGNLQIIADEEAFREGLRAPVMISTAEPGSWVLFTAQGGGLLDTRVVHVEGNVKLLQLDVNDAWVPNARLQANTVRDLKMWQDQQDINIPPTKHFLDVSVVTNAESYLPREKATAIITTRNIDGHAVPAEVALSVFDEAVLAIQPTLAPDPREFFYGQNRPITVYTSSSQNLRSFRINQKLAANEQLKLEGGVGTKYAATFADSSSANVDYFAAPTAELQTRAPALAPMMAKAAGLAESDAIKENAGAAPEPNVVVRNDFRSTVLWKPAIVTDSNGQATVEFQLPDNLTTWELEARATGLPASFGEGSTLAKTRLPLIARLQTPRFFVTGDQLTITGVINNNTEDDASVRAELAIDGGLKLVNSAMQSIDVPAHGSTQVNWMVDVVSPGDVKLTLTAKSNTHGDAMELTIPAFEHGINKFLARSGKMTSDSLRLALDIPKFKADGASFTLHLSPSIATTMLDALPYLAQYPYGCTEQTMSRFLPAVIIAKTLTDLGLNADDILEQNFGGIEENTPNKVVQKLKPKKDGNLADLDEMVSEGLKRLVDFQHSDGGWGWWKDDQSDPYMSAYVVWGLTLAEQSGEKIDAEVLKRGRDYLNLRLVDFESRYDMQAWLLHALAAADHGMPDAKPERNEAKAFANLWKNRDQMVAYSRALTAIAAKNLGFADEAKILADNLANGVKLDNNPQGSVLAPATGATPQDDPTILPTAHWGEDGIYYRWSRGGVETTAFVLAALVEINPQSELVTPAMNWLVKNRRGAQWSNTRDTAIVLLALNNWLRESGELEASGQYTALLNGEPIGEINVTPQTVLTAPRVIDVPVDKLKSGEGNTLTLQRKAGKPPLYFATRFDFFSLENPIAAAGSEIFVSRKYERTFPVKTLLDGFATQSSPLVSGGVADSGDRIEAIVTIEAKNDLEYILVEDLKPAGFEAVALQSGGRLYARELRPSALDQADRYTGRQQWVYQELRDRQIASFISRLPQGLWEIRYELRAETPGAFSALPVIAEAMYVPEIKGNSAELKITIEP
ncbi:alpha-2-macroglobulin family protein [Cerasicoccus maritimus]|uniref:alpha-2-macroglobulin family protein n=1 Tax=Cerasicoccus maritimus TaxID=490089 RepID=UPI002852D59E|nr:MG2 domain-containing protein [Cerasicoccus maritimus]